jgi:hypothetical protein
MYSGYFQVKHNYNGAFKRFVQTGRVVRISDGPYRGKLSSIVDVINQTTVSSTVFI